MDMTWIIVAGVAAVVVVIALVMVAKKRKNARAETPDDIYPMW